MLWIALLIFHGLVAFLLLGAVTHQAVSLAWPGQAKQNFVGRFASVRGGAYVNAVIALFAATFSLGAVIYADYRVGARISMEQMRMLAPIGMFELKEHILGLSLGLLPTYWFLWKKAPLADQRGARLGVTLLLAVACWWAFLVGHILNNIRGIGP